MIAVIIPFFQRQPGILARALRSVNAQQGVTGAQVIVVDDESPVSAQSELEVIEQDPRFPVTVLRQPNGGPGAARNKALDSLGAETRYVAFLDSDDEWAPDHLARACRALEAGYDAYFADFLQPGQSTSAFARAGRIRPADHPTIASSDDLHAYTGDMFTQILTGNVIGTPTVVYDFERFPRLRFREEFRRAGEDYLFWMGLADLGARYCFSSRVEVTCGHGVNVYSGAGWGTDGHLERVQNEMKYRKVIAGLFPVSAALRGHLADQSRRLREAFVRDLLHRLAHRRSIPMTVLREQLRIDPATFLLIVPLSLKLVCQRTAADRNAPRN